MSESSPNEVPRTAGELRLRLAELGEPWTVDARLADGDLLPDYARGGQPDDEVPEETRPRALDPEADLRELLSEEPPTNPFLQVRWAQAGILAPEDVAGLPESAGEGVEEAEGS